MVTDNLVRIWTCSRDNCKSVFQATERNFSEEIFLYENYPNDLTSFSINGILAKWLAEMSHRLGILAQLGEHLPYKQRVTGSSPVGPTLAKEHFERSVILAGYIILYGEIAQLARAYGSYP